MAQVKRVKSLETAFRTRPRSLFLRVQRLPESCPEVAPPFRRTIVRRYPSNIYSGDDARVLVVIVHHSRNPAVAMRRLKRP